jgi:hypothetical protein
MARGELAAKMTMQLGADISELKKGVAQAKTQLKGFGAKAKAASKSFAAGMKANAQSMAMMNPQFAAMSSAVSGLKGGFKALTMGSKGLAKAMWAIPIMAIIGAVSALIGWLQKTNEGMLALSRASEVVQAVFGVIIDRVAKLGGAIVKVLKGDFAGAWEDTKDAFDGFGKNIVDVAKAADKVAKDEFKNKEKLVKHLTQQN